MIARQPDKNTPSMPDSSTAKHRSSTDSPQSAAPTSGQKSTSGIPEQRPGEDQQGDLSAQSDTATATKGIHARDTPRAIASAPVDPATAALLALIDGDPIHERDRQAVITAIFAAAAANDGAIDPNRVRPHIPSWVQPRVVGATYNSLAAHGLIAWTGEWVTSDDSRGRNSGKPARLYRLVKAPNQA